MIGLVFFYVRRTKGRAGTNKIETSDQIEDKPQLHSDHLPVRQIYEMDASMNPSEMHTHEDFHHRELAANEIPAQEMSVGESQRGRSRSRGVARNGD